MGAYIQILSLVIAGIVLFWIGYSLFFGKASPFYPYFFHKKPVDPRGTPGDPQVCPICSMRLVKGDLVKSFAFPSSGGIDRLMYIKGCFSCLENNVPRRCPICKKIMSLEDYLVARMFERPNRKNHVHVLGCNSCRGTGNSMK
jgi:hypothetical protein